MALYLPINTMRVHGAEAPAGGMTFRVLMKLAAPHWRLFGNGSAVWLFNIL